MAHRISAERLAQLRAIMVRVEKRCRAESKANADFAIMCEKVVFGRRQQVARLPDRRIRLRLIMTRIEQRMRRDAVARADLAIMLQRGTGPEILCRPCQCASCHRAPVIAVAEQIVWRGTAVVVVQIVDQRRFENGVVGILSIIVRIEEDVRGQAHLPARFEIVRERRSKCRVARKLRTIKDRIEQGMRCQILFPADRKIMRQIVAGGDLPATQLCAVMGDVEQDIGRPALCPAVFPIMMDAIRDGSYVRVARSIMKRVQKRRRVGP